MDKGSIPLRPIYPSLTSLDSLKKKDVFLLSLKSVSDLNIKKIILNLEFDEQFNEYEEDLMMTIRSFFPNAEMLSEEKRPTNIDQWKESTEFAAKFFGEENPVICFFNHDHIFVDPISNVFEQIIESLFSSNKDIYFIYSHAPETISFLNDDEAYDFRLKSTLDLKIQHSKPKQISNIFFNTLQKGHIDGIFVSTVNALRKMWSAALSSTEYAPRPDWPGVTFGDHVFNLVSTQREFFRHFDGYGHVSSIPHVLGMGLSDFDEQGKFRNRKLMSDLLNQSKTEHWKSDLVKIYFNLFCETYLLMIRDLHYVRVVAGKHKTSPRQDFLKALQLFIKNQVQIDSRYLNLTGDDLKETIILLTHYIFARENEIFALIDQDVRLWQR